MLVNQRTHGVAQMPESPRPQWPKVWLVGFSCVFLLLAGFGDVVHIVQFAWDSASVEGTVSAIEAENHNATRLVYMVNGSEYEVVSSYKPPTERGPAVVLVGQKVRLYYLRSAPGDASLQTPAELLGGAFFQASLLAALGATFITYLTSVSIWRPGRV